MKKLILTIMLLLMMMVATSVAQDDTTTEDDGSTIFFFFAACDTQAVVDLNGFMEPGFDVYVQVFDSVGGAGTPLTPLTRVSVDGDYQVSQVLPYNNDRTLLLGQFASAVFTIASETDSSNVIYTDGIDEVYDTCIEPSFPSTDTFTSANQSAGSTPLVDPATGEIINTGNVIQSSGIFTPDGGTLNEIFSEPQEAVVQIGARASDLRDELFAGRVSDPGLIFAECDKFPLADPGVVWDTDELVIFWSWFAATPELAQQHIANAQYEVFLSSDFASRQPFQQVNVSQPVLREDGNYYVFYTANLGNGFRSGDYRVDYYVTWDNVIDDGYDLFGPGTATTEILSTCSFRVERNPFGVPTSQNNPTVPLQQP